MPDPDTWCLNIKVLNAETVTVSFHCSSTFRSIYAVIDEFENALLLCSEKNAYRYRIEKAEKARVQKVEKGRRTDET
jgi:hypothetical protein